MYSQKLGQPAQIHGRGREREEQVDFVQSAQLHLAKDAVLFAVTVMLRYS